MTVVRWGLLSTANINRRVIPALRQSPRAALTAVASRQAESAADYAAKWEIPRHFGSYEALLADDAIDAVYISLPNHLHATWAIRALEAGKHVLCEKPLALNVADVDRMAAAAQKAGRRLAEAFMYRHHPQTKLLGEWVQGGQLGDILLVQSTFNYAMSERANNVRLVPEYGGGCLWDVGVYPVSLAQYVLGGPPQTVYARQWLGVTGVDEYFAAQMHYAGGGVAHISSAFNSPFYANATIIGTRGRLTLNRPYIAVNDEAELIYHPANGEPERLNVPEEYLYLGEIEDMNAAILEGGANYVGLAESRDHVATVVALYDAARDDHVIAD